MKAEEAARRAREAQQKKNKAASEKRAEKHAADEREASELAPKFLKRLRAEIVVASNRGHTSLQDSHMSASDVTRLALFMVMDELRKDGYECSTSTESQNMQDSSDPCMVEFLMLNVSWEPKK